MDVEAVLKRLDAERRELCRDGETVEILPSVTRLRPDDGAYHCVVYSALSECTADGAIAEQILHYRGLGASFEWKVYSHDRPADLLRRLADRGFAVGPKEAVLVLDLEHPPPWVAEPGPCRVVRVENMK